MDVDRYLVLFIYLIMRCDMKKKILLLALLGIVLTGCSVDYSVTIDSDTFEEVVDIYANELDSSELEYYENSKQDKFISFYDGSDHFYQTGFNDASHKFSLSYDYNDYIPYSLSSIFHDCFSSSSIVTNEDKVTIKATGFVCYNYNYTNLEDLNVYVTVHDYLVVSHNATNSEGNRYSWAMQNGQFPDIELVLLKEEQEEPNNSACDIVSCDEDEELINPNSEDCYCKKKSVENGSTIEEDGNMLFEYILLGGILLLFAIAIIGLIKYKSIHD